MKSLITTMLVVITTFISAASLSAALTNVCEYSFPASYNGSGTTVTDLGPFGNNATTFSNINSYVAEAPPSGSGGSFNASIPNDFITDTPRLLSNAVIEAYGGFSYDVWFKWDGEDCVNGKIIDYAGTEILAFNNGKLVFGIVNNPGYNYSEISTNGLVQDVWY